MNFRQFLEQNWKLPTSARMDRPEGWRNQWGKSQSVSARRLRWGNEEAEQAAAKAYDAVDPKAVAFIAQEYADAIIQSLEKYSERNVNLEDLLFNFNITNRVRNYDERVLEFTPYRKLKQRIRQIFKDKDQRENIYDFVEMEAVALARRKVMEHFSSADFEVRIYGTVRAYGGPEEGGWWYNHKDLVKRIPVKGLRAAYKKYLETKEAVKGQGEDNFYKDIQTPSDDARMASPEDDYEQEGMWLSRGWKPSGHEKYFVSLNLKGAPSQSTKQPPRYS